MWSAVPYLSLIAALALAYWPRSIAGREMSKMTGGYDNHLPRDQQARLDGMGRRALAAHQNSMEALVVFGIALLAAMQRHVNLSVVALFCAIFLLARLVYVLAYLSDRPPLRSGMFSLGMLTCCALLAFAAFT
jgi:uncharacterized MAPEG superfamily protein